MTRSLVIAPQWIGDAVMAEPLLAALARRGERAHGGGPALGRAGVPGDAAGRRDRRAAVRAWPARLGGAARVAAALRGRFDVAYVLPNSIKSALVPWLAQRARCGSATSGEGRWLLLNRRLADPADDRPPMVAFYGALAGSDFDRARAAAACSSTPATLQAALAEAGARSRRLLDLRAGRRVRPGQALAGRALRRARRGAARRRRRVVALLGSPGEAALLRSDRRRRRRRLPRARRQDLAARRDGLDRRGTRPGEQRLWADARRRRLRRGAGRRCSARPARCTRRRSTRSARVLWLKDELGLDMHAAASTAPAASATTAA